MRPDRVVTAISLLIAILTIAALIYLLAGGKP